jgi:hypothetical protein
VAVTWARQALERELYWRTDPVAGEPLSPAEELRVRVEELARALRRDATQAAPWGDPSLSSSTGLKRKYKIALHRLLRPLSRRYDRISAELAATCVALADLSRRFETESEQLRQEIAALQRDRAAGGSEATTGDR